MKIKLIASDLDGTLLKHNKFLSEENRTALEDAIARGIQFVPATGRAYQAITEEIRQFPGVEYFIINNGAAIYSVSRQERIYSRKLTGEAVDALLAIPAMEETALETYIDGVSYGDADYVAQPEKYGSTSFGAMYVRSTRLPVEDMRSFIKEHRNELDSLSFVCKDSEKREILTKEIVKIPDTYLTSSVDHLLEIAHQEAGKGKALKALLEILGISPEQVMAFGDADNDKEMLKEVAYGIAMGNASESCKQAAYAVTASNEEDGVGKMIRKMLQEAE